MSNLSEVAKGKEVAFMERLIKVLAVTVLMVVLMATIVSTAFAANNNNGNGWQCETNCGYCGTGQGGPDKWKGDCTARR
jgi:hypothetical protein